MRTLRDRDRGAGAPGVDGGLDGGADGASGARVKDGVAIGVDRLGEVLGELEAVVVGDPLMGIFGRRLSPIVDANLGTRLADDERALRSEHMNLNLADVRVAGGADASDAQRSEDALIHLQRDGCQVLNVVVNAGLMEVRGGAGKNLPNVHSGQHAYVGKRIDSLNLQFPHGIGAHAAI